MKRPYLPVLFVLLTHCYTRDVLAHGDVHEQILELTARLREDSRNAELYHKRGELHREHGEYQKALLDYARAERLAPSLEVVHLSRGRALLETGRHQAAVESLSKFLAQTPGHSHARLLRAQALGHLRRHDEAERDYEAAFAAMSDPGPDVYLERAHNLARAGRATRALEVLEQAKTNLGSLVTLESAALELELALARYDAALARVDRMITELPRGEAWLARKAAVLDRAGRHDEARDARLEALAALERLPPAKRGVKATRELERELRAAVAHGSHTARK